MSVEYPNSGFLFSVLKMTHEKSPHFYGYIDIDKEYLKMLIESTDSHEVKIKIDGWKKKDKNNKHMVSLKVNNYEQKQATQQSDPWDD
jgi:hypothetical protein